MRLEDVVGTLIAVEGYRRIRYAHAARMTLALLAIAGVSLFGTLALASREDKYQYILTEIDGRLSNPVALTEPNMTDDEVAQWASAAITRVYTFDFANFRRQFQDAQKYLTVYGMNEFLSSMRTSGNFTSIIENKYALTAAPTGPARILWKGPIPIETGGFRYGWKLEIPIVISYRSSIQDVTQRLMIRATVGRMPERTTDGSGLGIRQILAQ